MPKISVIIPVYNAEPYLAKCLDSVINQTLKDIEIICVNDGSSDNSLEILKEYANKDERIKLITKPNSGYGHTMNVGFDNSTGEYIGIVEPDDYIKLDMYESLYEKAVEFDVDFAKADFYYWWSNEDKLAHYNCVSDENLYEKTIENFYDPKLSPGTVANWAGIYKRDFLAKNNIRHLETPGASYQDQGFYYSVIFNAKKAYYLNTPFYYYRQDNMASSVNSKDKIYCIFDEYVEIEKKLSEHPDKAKFNKIVFLKKYNSCNWNYRRINKKFKKSFYKRMCEEFALSYYYGDVLRQNFEIEQWDKIRQWTKDYEKSSKINITPKSTSQKIPIVLSSDSKYAPQMFTAIISILENKNFNSFYDFYLLISEDFSKKYQQKFLNLEKKYSNIKINFTNMKKSFSALNQMVSHITSPTYYRLKMSEILPATYDKVIYLDVDTIILTDLSEYFNIDISDNYIAGTIAAGYIMNWEERKDYYTSIGLPSTSQYINAGVTLWNLKKIREENLTEKMCELAKNNYETVDQDVVNLLFYNNIKHVPLYYNVMTKYKGLFDNTLDEYEKLVEIYSEKDIKTALSAPKIIHFADRIKPWDNSNIEFADMWIKYYNLHPFSRCCKRSLFSIVNIKNNKRKAIYKVVTFLGIKLKFKHKSRTAALRAKEASQKALA